MRTVPEPPEKIVTQLAFLEKSRLTYQHDSLLFEVRKLQAEQMGFESISIGEVVREFMGEDFTHKFNGRRQSNEWAYDHHSKKFLGSSWGSNVGVYEKRVRLGLFFKKPVWTLWHGKVSCLKCFIPEDILCKMQECFEYNLFNAFSVVAPDKAFKSDEPSELIILGELWLLPRNQLGEVTILSKSSEEVYYKLN